MYLGFYSRVAVSSHHPTSGFARSKDAFCVSSNLLAVADGVSAGSNKPSVGISHPNEYARRVTRSLQSFAEHTKYKSSVATRAALQHAISSANIACLGSSTVIMTSLEQDRLTLLNLGACSGMIVRGMHNGIPELVHRTAFPSEEGNTVSTSSDATVHQMDVEEGDFVILGSDVIFDNVFDEDILQVVSHYVQCAAGGSEADLNRSLHRAAAQIVRHARAATRGAAVKTPIQHRAPAQGASSIVSEIGSATILIGAIGRDEAESTCSSMSCASQRYAAASYASAEC